MTSDHIPSVTIILVLLLATAPLSADCSDIRILESGLNRAELAILDMASLVDPGPNQRKIVEDAKSFFSPLHCHAVTRVAFLSEDGDDGTKIAWVGGTIHDLLNISATSSKATEMNLSQRGVAPTYRAATVTTLVHEATHAADNLLNHVAPRREKDLGEKIFASNDWNGAAIEYVREVVASNLLDEGLRHEWRQMHERAVALDLAMPYHHQGDKNMSADAVIKMGVASGYGGDNAAEDIAEMTSGILAARAWAKYGVDVPEPPDDLICERMRAAPGPGIPDELALIYTKVGLLNSVGLIGDLEYDYCVGNLRVRAPGNGFFTLRNGRQRNSYTGDVGGSIGTSSNDGSWVFRMQADGEVGVTGQGMKPARIELTIPLAAAGQPRPSFPRGLYAIGRGIAGKGAGATVNIYYQDDGEEKLGVTMESGLVLVSRASTKLVEGSIFVFRFVNWTSLLPWPEGAGDMVIPFRKQNR